MTKTIALLALGTRGDVQPYIALGKALRANGCHVRIFAGSSFADWVRSHNLDFVPTIDIEAVMKSETGVAWVEGDSQRQQLTMMRRLLDETSAAMLDPLADIAQTSDLLIAGFVSEPFAHVLCDKFGTPLLVGALQPYLPTRAGSASLVAALPRRSSVLNRLLGLLAVRLLWGVSARAVNEMRTGLGLPTIGSSVYQQSVRTVQHLFGISPHVVPTPADYAPGDRMLGYWFLDESAAYQPPEALTSFLAAGEPPIYIGFGSSTARDPQAKVDLAAAALERAGRRGIFLAGWSGADPARSYPHLHVIRSAPHDWLFPRMAAIVHHGGAGTTAAALRSGRPSLIIPHFADQPYWGRRVHELGVGPAPIPRPQLSVEGLSAALRQMTTDSALIDRAARLGEAIRAEDGLSAMVDVVQSSFN